MKNKMGAITVIGGLLITAFFLGTGPASADEASLQAEIQALKQRISQLEVRLEKPEAARPTPVSGEAAGGLRLSGMVEVGGNYNFNEPTSRANFFHEFDARANSFSLDMFELIVQHQSQDKPVAVRADLVVGEVAESIASTGTIVDDIDLQQAYVSWKPNILGRDIDIWAGKYVTLAGAEVIPDPSGWNWNLTRSYMFFYSIPFTHLGIRSMIPVVDKVSAYLGLNNGWDVVEDNNEGKTLETALSITPWDWLSVFSSFYYGNEAATGSIPDKRSVWSTVATIKSPWDNEILDRLTLMLNYDLGHEDFEGTRATGISSNWDGLATYARYMITEKLGFNFRYEYFNDNDGARTASANGIASTSRPNAAVILQEVTFTLDYPVVKELIGRLEYRHDWTDDKFFLEEGKRVNDQDIVSAEMIYLF